MYSFPHSVFAEERTIRKNHEAMEMPIAIMMLATESSTAETSDIAMTIKGKAIKISHTSRMISSNIPPL